MGEKTAIGWTEHTFNSHYGCSKVSPGCAKCYMFREMTRYGLDPNVVTKSKTWNQPFAWNKKAKAAGRQEMVFTCSWSDFFIAEADEWRPEVWNIIRATDSLIYQILTKRPERILDHLPPDWGDGYKNVWLGVSVENADYLHRIDILRTIPAHCRFLSAEPLLGPLTGLNLEGIHWVITGGESGKNYREMDISWVKEIQELCKTANVAFFHKQGSGLKAGKNDTIDGVEYKDFPRISLPLI